ncbi:MAG: 30S ribosomal protein S6 [Saprospiraceae bacterium]|nr:30S ribosomal protein S6 [Saprospiraceae bacterium]
MRQYEVNLIVDPVLSQDEISSTAKTYSDLIKEEGGEIVHVDEMGLKQLAYPINRRNTGVYYSIEFQVPEGQFIDKLELALRRDERIMRYLTVKLDKYGVKYNDDKRKGLIGKVKTKEEKKKEADKAAEKRSERAKATKKAADKKAADKKAAEKKEAAAAKAGSGEEE